VGIINSIIKIIIPNRFKIYSLDYYQLVKQKGQVVVSNFFTILFIVEILEDDEIMKHLKQSYNISTLP